MLTTVRAHMVHFNLKRGAVIARSKGSNQGHALYQRRQKLLNRRYGKREIHLTLATVCFTLIPHFKPSTGAVRLCFEVVKKPSDSFEMLRQTTSAGSSQG